MEEDEQMKIVLELSRTEEEINKLNRTIYDLTQELKENTGEDKIEDLKLFHQLNENDILEYKKQIEILQSTIKLNSEIIENLKKENEQLKLNKNKEIINKEKDDKQKHVNNIKEFTKKFGIHLINKIIPSLSKEIKEKENKEEITQEILNKYLLEKDKYQKLYDELIIKCNDYYDEENRQKRLVKAFKTIINKINSEIQNLNNNFNVEIPNLPNLNSSEGKKLLEDINSKVDVVSSNIIDLEEIHLETKKFLIFENLLSNIYNNIKKINDKDYNNEYSLKNILNGIKGSIEELQNICFLADEQLEKFNNKNKIINKQINELMNIQKECKKENIKRNNSIRQSIIPNKKNGDINNIIKNMNGNKNNEINLDNIPTTQSILIKPKGSKEDLYKTTYLFSKEEDVNESYYSKLLEKNWHEICYVYDDYDIYEVNYILKAVGLLGDSIFKQATFLLPKKSKIQLLTVNGKNVNYTVKYSTINFDINLKNLETAKIHIKYSQKKDIHVDYIQNYYGSYGITSKVNEKLMGKFILILKGSYDIIDFEDEFFIKNEKNKNDPEYIWGGLVPSGGSKTEIRFTKKKAKWENNFHFSVTEKSGKNFNYCKFYIYLKYLGGNNNILDFKYSSPQSQNFYLDEQNNQLIAECKNNNKFEVNVSYIIENDTHQKWNINLTDEEIEKNMPREDVRDKAILKKIAQKIIKDFDEEHKDCKYEYLDFMKIGKWVYENIKYTISYLGRHELTALDIYNQRKGVCHHYSRLSCALLYSLGYPTVYIYGNCVDTTFANFKFTNIHAWSAVKIGNRWYPFDATWNLLKGKVPITHIFSNINLKGYFRYNVSNGIVSYEQKSEGKILNEKLNKLFK